MSRIRHPRSLSFVAMLTVLLPLCEGVTAGDGQSPRNGGFEQVEGEHAAGWEFIGAWRLDTNAPHSGRYCVSIHPDDSAPWNKVLTSGCCARVSKGDRLVLSGFYESATGNVDIGLRFCDELGGHIGWSGVKALGPAKEWTPVQHEYTITDEQYSAGVRMVKIYAQVTRAQSHARFDDIQLVVKRAGPRPVAIAKPVKINPLSTNELLPADELEHFQDGRPQSYEVFKAPEETGTIELDTAHRHSGAASLKCSNVSRLIMLARKPLPIDPQIGYEVSCFMKCSETDASRGVLEAVLLDETGVPVGKRFEEWIAWHSDFIEKRISIPHDGIPSDAVQVRIVIGVRGRCPGSVWFDDISVRPQALELSMSSEHLSNLFHVGEPVKFMVRMYSGAPSERSCTLSITVENFWGTKSNVLQGDIRLPARTTMEKTVEMDLPCMGYFKATAMVRDGQEVLREAGTDLALVTPFSEKIFAQDSPFGSHAIGRHPEKFIQLMREAYVKWVRTGAGWAWTERQRGQYDWSGLDRSYGLYLENGLELMPIVMGTPQWISRYEEGMPKTRWGVTFRVYPPREYGPLTDFCAALAARFKDKIRYWEVWNEPNYSNFWMGSAQDFAAVLKAAYVGLHRGNADCQVIFEAGGTDLSFYDVVYRNGGKGHFDILGTHNYQLSHPGPPEASTYLQEYYDMRKFLARRGESGKPIWDTEFCWMSRSPRNRPGWKGVGENKQADYLIRSWVLALSAGVKRMFWFPFYSYTSGELNEPHPGGLVRGDYSLKPVFVAHRTIAERLVGAKYSREIEVGPEARCYVFEKNDGEVAVCWAIAGKKCLSVMTAARSVSVFDIMNNKSARSPHDDVLTFAVDGSPVFVESGKPFEPVSAASSERLVLRIADVKRLDKRSLEVTVSVRNRSNAEIAGAVSVPPLAKTLTGPTPREFKLPPKDRTILTFVIALKASRDFSEVVTARLEEARGALEVSKRVPAAAVVLAAPLRQTVTMDGDASEWAEDGRDSVVEKDDMLAYEFHKIWSAYDDENVYLAFAVPLSTGPKGLELLFDVNNDGRMTEQDGDFRMHVGFADCSLTRRGQRTENVRIARMEKDGMLLCELAIPREVGGFRASPGKTLGLGITFEEERGKRFWPPAFDGEAINAGEIAFTWRAADGSYPQVFRKDLGEVRNIKDVLTAFPDDRAFMYEIFCSEEAQPSDSLDSSDWRCIVPRKVVSGAELDSVNVRARHFATRLTDLLTDSSFEHAAQAGVVEPKPGEEDIDLWRPDREWCQITKQGSHSGLASAHIAAAGRTEEPRNRWSNWRQIVAAKPNMDYTLSGYIKVVAMQDGCAKLAAHSYAKGGEGFSNYAPSVADRNVSGWQRIVMRLRTADNDNRIRVFCDVDLNGEALFDDVHLIEGTTPTDLAEIISQDYLQ